MNSGKNKILVQGLVILILALGIRIPFALYAVHLGPKFFITKDSQEYDLLALNLVHRGQFRALPFSLEELNLPKNYEEEHLLPGYLSQSDTFTGPEVKRVPLFPLFLGLIYAIFGYNPAHYLFVQAVLSGLTCWLVYRIGVRLNRPRTGFIAGILLAVNPRAIIHIGLIQVETYFIFLLTLLILVMFRYMRRPCWRETITFGLLLGWATLSREMGLYLFILMAPAILSPIFRKTITPRAGFWAKTTVLFLIPILVIFGWMARNRHFFGYYVWTSHTGFSEVWWFAPMVMASVWNTTEAEARLKIMKEVITRYPEYAPDYEALVRNPDHYWYFAERVEMIKRSLPLARRYLIRNFPRTVSAFVGGAFWSLWSGIGEWRSIAISRETYESIINSGSVDQAKKALFRLKLKTCVGLILDLLRKIPLSAYIIFGYIWCLMVFLYATACLGIGPLWRIDPFLTATILLLIAFAGFLSGPAGNNRLFAMAYPALSLLSAAGTIKIVGWRGKNRKHRAASESR